MISTKAQMRPNRPFQATHPTIHQKEDFQLPLFENEATYQEYLPPHPRHLVLPRDGARVRVRVCACDLTRSRYPVSPGGDDASRGDIQ